MKSTSIAYLGRKFILIVILPLLMSCNQNQSHFQKLSPESQKLVSEANHLENQLIQGRLFTKSANYELHQFKVNLLELKNALILIDQNQKQKKWYTQALYALSRLKLVTVKKRDEFVIQSFLAKTSSHISKLAKTNNINIQDITFPLYATYFGGGIAPYQTIGKTDLWKTGIAQNENTYIAVSGRRTKSWLISPTFDLTQVQKPEINLQHLVMINQNFRFDLDVQEIQSKGFKLFITSDYKATDTDPEAKHIHWTELSLGKMPSTQNFHKLDVPTIAIDSFAGKKVTLGFRFENDSEHYITWQISKLEILGLGNLKVIDKAGSLFDFNFKSDSLSPFVKYPENNAWKADEFRGTTFAKIYPSGKNLSHWLVSAKFRFIPENENQLQLNIREWARSPVWEKMRILISTDFKNDVNKAQWHQLNRQHDFDNPEAFNKFLTTFSDIIELTEGKDFVIAFVYDENENDTGLLTWELVNINFVGIGVISIVTEDDL